MIDRIKFDAGWLSFVDIRLVWVIEGNLCVRDCNYTFYFKCRVGNAFLPTAFIGKWWANDEVVCPPWLFISQRLYPVKALAVVTQNISQPGQNLLHFSS